MVELFWIETMLAERGYRYTVVGGRLFVLKHGALIGSTQLLFPDMVSYDHMQVILRKDRQTGGRWRAPPLVSRSRAR